MTSEASLGAIAKGLTDRDLCSLSPAQLAERVAMIRREIQPLVVARTELLDGVAWEFESDAGTRTRLEKLAELERECCRVGLEFRVRDDVQAGRLHFEIHGAEADAFRALAASPREGLKRFAKAGGVGAAASFFVCCVIPIGVAAVAGASIAGPLLKLDHPGIIGAVAVAFGSATWMFQRRRDAARAAIAEAPDAAESGCGC